MKLTKRQLKRIIREEKQRLLKEQNPSAEFETIRGVIDGWSHRSEEVLSKVLSQIDPRWNEDPEVIDAILEALELMKSNIIEWGNQ
jgi:hypothetical protein